MRLIDTTTMEMRQYFPPNIPPYAILSHTWGPEEVTFQEFQEKKGRSKKGYRKITSAMKLVNRWKHKYIWIDTCCIDKTDSAELAEAINSMYQWYRDASVCIAFLEDVSRDVSNKDMFNSRWFTRGWTLQELVAPRNVQFYDAEWTSRGSKVDFVDAIFARTNVPRRILMGQAHPVDYSLARRMSWAAGRQTTRIEDIAYSLLGIFDVNMPLLYGEGQRAFRRLQEEIVKRTSDLTILAWKVPKELLQTNGNGGGQKPPPSPTPPAAPSLIVTRYDRNSFLSGSKPESLSVSPSPSRSRSRSPSSVSATTVSSSPSSAGKRIQTELCLFAPSPATFAESASLHPFADDFENFSVTNRGLFVSGSVYLRLTQTPPTSGNGPHVNHYLLLVGSQFGSFVGIRLIKIGPNLFQRDWDSDMAVLTHDDVMGMRGFLVTDWYILIDRRPANSITPESFRVSSIHVPAEGCGNADVSVKDYAPTFLWDVQDRLFLRPKAYLWTRYDMVLALKCAVTLRDTTTTTTNPTKQASSGPKSLDDSLELWSRRVSFVVLCDYRFHRLEPRLSVFLESDFPAETEMLLIRRAPNNSFMWADLAVVSPQIAKLPDYVFVNAAEWGGGGGGGSGNSNRKGGKAECWYRISVKATKGQVQLSYADPELYSIHFSIDPVPHGPDHSSSSSSNNKTNTNSKDEKKTKQPEVSHVKPDKQGNKG